MKAVYEISFMHLKIKCPYIRLPLETFIRQCVLINCYMLCVQVALDSRKRVFTWGFGGYGRLGHSETKDELVPRLVKALEALGKGIKGVYCGSSFTLCINEHSE